MVKRVSHKTATCPVARPLDAIGDGWSMLIVRDAFEGATRFGEFQQSLRLAKNILAARLRNLVEHGILEMVPPTEECAYHQYALTGKGRGLFPLLVALRQWGEDYWFEPGETHVELVDRKHGAPVRRLRVHDSGGKALRPEQTLVRKPVARRARRRDA